MLRVVGRRHREGRALREQDIESGRYVEGN